MAPALTLLVIDDEPQIRRVVRHTLEAEDARVLEAASGREGCRDIRAWSTVPIVVLSARHSDREKAALLDAGADDYITKPFSTLELQARVRAQLRRARMRAEDTGDQRIE